ncbi:MAG: hypothetical protein GY754_39420 [bacterium]|nr:hypothetical protein [bacterium]
MIKINKPAEIPEILQTNGVEETRRNLEEYLAFENEFKAGTRTFEFKNEIYGHKEVKKILRKAQHDKCCFCERKEEIGDIEHFRPKGAYKQDRDDKRSKVGYYWLAYDWDNLYFSCPKCNRRYKGNLFPLAEDSKRAKSHRDCIENEEPIFINPAKDNPEEYIEYKGDSPKAINDNFRGKTTIKETGINREFLHERRSGHYRNLKFLYTAINLPDIEKGLKNEIEQILAESIEDSAEFASMIRCALKDEFCY